MNQRMQENPDFISCLQEIKIDHFTKMNSDTSLRQSPQTPERGLLHHEDQENQEEDEAQKKRRLKNSPANNDNSIIFRKSQISRESPMNFGLKRSFSSPDLAMLKDAKESLIGTSSKSCTRRENIRRTRNITRTLQKDSPIKRMNPIYGHTSPGITGLKNLGNSCYMNSVIQCISHTPHLVEYFMNNGYKDHLNINTDNKTRKQVAEQFAQVIRALWGGLYKSFSPIDFKDVIGEYKLEFGNYDQQDAHEFLTFFLEWIHNDLRRDMDTKEDGSLSSVEKEWVKLMKSQCSIISDFFMGQLRSTIRCSTCSYKSETYEIFTSLSLSLPEANHCTLNECIRHFFEERQITGWNCPHCKTAREATIKYDLVKSAQNFIIHLKRFANDDTGLGKKNTSVIFPIEQLNLRPYLVIDPESITSEHQDYNYHLYGLSSHYGTMNGGHYTAFCKNAPLNKWHKYDDSSVFHITEQDVESQKAHAYLLLYTSKVTIANQSLNQKPREETLQLAPKLQKKIALKTVQVEENEGSRNGKEKSNLLNHVANSEPKVSESAELDLVLLDLVSQVYPRKIVR